MHTLRLATAAVLLGLLAPLGTASAQPSLTAQNGATLEVQKELDVPGDLSKDGSSTVTFGSGGALTLSGSSQQSVAAGPIAVADLELDNSNGATLNSAVDVTGTLTLTSGALTTNGNLTLASSSETSAAAIAGSGSGSVSGDVTFERRLAKGDDASHFRMLAPPTATVLDDEGSGSNAGNLLSNVWTQATGSGADAQVSDPANASVFDYDEGATLGGDALSSAWSDVANLDGSVSPGEGHLAYLFADRDPDDESTEGFPETLTAVGSVQGEENSGSAVDLSGQITYTDNDSQSEDGWNLIANPFMAPIDWESVVNDGLNSVDNTIYVYDATAGTYATYTADGSPGGSGNQGRYIAPFQAFFVKASSSSPDIGGIDASDKATGQSPEVKSEPEARPTLTLELRAEGDSTGETTVVRYSDDAAPGKDAYDAYQLEPLSASYALVASEMDGVDALFDHQNRPVPAAQDTVDLALDVTQGGSFVLEAGALEGVPSDWRVILKNMDSGARYDLGAGETVSFEHVAPNSKKTSSPASVRARLEGGPTVAKAADSGDLPSFRLFVGPEAALPVEWAGFDAEANGQEVVLTWKTASETNSAGFVVDRKGGDGQAWREVGYVESKASGGTTAQPQRYQFTDSELPFEAEQLTYRLRQEDLDGSTSSSDEVTVELGASSETKLHAPFPNPASGEVLVRYEIPPSLRDGGVRIALFDVLGRRIRTVIDRPIPAGRHEETLQTSGLPAGTYFLRLRAGGTSHTRRLTVVR